MHYVILGKPTIKSNLPFPTRIELKTGDVFQGDNIVFFTDRSKMVFADMQSVAKLLRLCIPSGGIDDIEGRWIGSPKRNIGILQAVEQRR